MALPENRQLSELMPVGPTSSRLLSEPGTWQALENLYPTEEGGYASIVGMFPYVHPTSGASLFPGSATTPNASNGTYGPMYGIHHCILGARDVLLLHTGEQLWELHPWDNAQKWHILIGDTSSAQLDRKLPRASALNDWPTQFVSTGSGVVILAPEGRAYYYDGHIVAPLGFGEAPAAPSGRGPKSSATWVNEATGTGDGQGDYVNDKGYAHNRLMNRGSDGDDIFGFGRVGTVESLPNINTSLGDLDAYGEGSTAAQLLEGRWRCRVAWIDPWGNLSPLSGDSNDVTCDRQLSTGVTGGSGFKGSAGAGEAVWLDAKCARFHMLWQGFGGGPEHTVGKNLYRTKDLLNSGDTNYYLLSNHAQVSADAFATIPDAMTPMYPDNTPDGWLSVRAPEVDPVPIHRLGALAFGRYWAAHLLGAPASLRPSVISLYGTFEAGELYTPDPTAGQITGLHTIDQGLLVFTETSTFLFMPNDSGRGFQFRTLSASIGCAAPSSIAMTRFGMTVWLARDGFYGFDGQQIRFLFDEHRDLARQFNLARIGASNGYFDPRSGQYHCWVPWQTATKPNRRFKFDGRYWTHDAYSGLEAMVSTTVTADHRSMVIGAGDIENPATGTPIIGVWALDHGHDTQTATAKTGWIRAFNSNFRASIKQVRFWLRETGNGSATIKIRRDYRNETDDPDRTIGLQPEVVETGAPSPYHQRTPHTLYKNADLWDVDSSSTAVVRRRRPFWTHRTIQIPKCEVFQLEISSSSFFEIAGLQYDFEYRDPSGSSNRR